MKMRTLLAASAALVLGGLATSATAAVSVLGTQNWNLDGALLHGQSYIQDYDNALASGFVYVGDNAYTAAATAYVKSGTHIPGETAPPPVLDGGNNIVYESSEYQTVETGGYASIAAVGKYFKTFSLYMGSPDAHNNISFRLYQGDTLLQTLSGDDIWNGAENEDDGSQTWGKRIYYSFGNDKVTKIEFTATGNSFEFDGLAATTAAIPEPGTWALMIAGFGGAGAMLRRRKALMA